MNTEATQNRSVVFSIGERLRIAREQMGFTQQNIAERLYLKLSIVRDIEEDKSPLGLEWTFLRGYIRSYAKLVHVPENDLFPIITTKITFIPIKKNKQKSLHLFKIGHKKINKGVIFFTGFIILLIIISLTSSWWWKNHKTLSDNVVAVIYDNNIFKDNKINNL